MADLACNISTGSTCHVDGSIDSLTPPKIIEQDGSPFNKAFSKGETRTLKIENYNPSLTYIIRHTFDSRVEIGTDQLGGESFSLTADNHYEYIINNTKYVSNPNAQYFQAFETDSGACGSQSCYLNTKDGTRISMWSGTGSIVAYSLVTSGNYVSLFFQSYYTDTEETGCKVPTFVIHWYKDVDVNETLNVNSDGTFTYTAPNATCTPMLTLYFEKAMLKSNSMSYTLNVS